MLGFMLGQCLMTFNTGVSVLLLVAILVSMVSAGAPGDEDIFCTNDSYGVTIPLNSKILLDSYNYVNLLPPQDNAVWQVVNNDDNNEAGRGTEVRVLLVIVH